MRVLHALTILCAGFLFVVSPIEARNEQENSPKTTSFVTEKDNHQRTEAKLKEGLSLKRLYNKVVNDEEFEQTRKQGSVFQSRSTNTNGVRVERQLSPEEIAYFKETSTGKKEKKSSPP